MRMSMFDEAKKSISMQRTIITGVLEPILERTVFRGFLIVSLTMCTGVALGFSYSQTRNLLTPIAVDAVWNSGVTLLLTVLSCRDVRSRSCCRHLEGFMSSSSFYLALILYVVTQPDLIALLIRGVVLPSLWS